MPLFENNCQVDCYGTIPTLHSLRFVRGCGSCECSMNRTSPTRNILLFKNLLTSFDKQTWILYLQAFLLTTRFVPLGWLVPLNIHKDHSKGEGEICGSPQRIPPEIVFSQRTIASAADVTGYTQCRNHAEILINSYSITPFYIREWFL